MSQSICILGRQPALGRAELESLYGAQVLQTAGEQAMIVDLSPDQLDFSRLGGTVKLGKVLTRLSDSDWSSIEQHLLDSAPRHAASLPEGKLQLGLSAYGMEVKPAQLQATGLKLKKAIRISGRSVRLIPNQELALSSAQVLHNHLTKLLGWELLIVRDKNSTILAQTVAVQNITAYARRDQKRPKRDARVGMLPPKLAQILVNLAVSNTDPKFSAVVLDPFCGTGVILQEAQLMGFGVYGTDIEPRMVDYGRQNLQWLHETHKVATNYYQVALGDATTQTWNIPKAIYFVASEAYLGPPLTSLPAPEKLKRIVHDVNTITKGFLQNLAHQSQSGLRLCLAVPAWSISGKFTHLPILDHLAELGYTRLSFKHARVQDLVYHRPGQIVARELVVLIKK